MDVHELAEKNADVLRFGTLFTARQVPRYLSDEEGIARAADWCRSHGIRHVYLESFRGEVWAPKGVLARARDRFREEGLQVSGCITPAQFGKQSTGWYAFTCFTSEQSRRTLREMAEHAAGVFDVVMIDDFFCSDCTCDECRAALGDQSWSDYKRSMMAELARTHVIEAGRAVNPDVEFIIKYPAWHEIYQERGYDVAAESELFPRTWVGTETRGVVGQGEARFRREPQYRAYWLMRWLAGIGGDKCGGGWYDAIDTDPTHFVEQGRQTVLGGAREAFLFNFGSYQEDGRHERGPADMAALVEEMPEHFELARLIQGREPRGLSGWKPPNSRCGGDWNLHVLLGMAGFPVTAAHRFQPDAPGFVLGYHVLDDPAWWDGVEHALDVGRPVVTTETFLRAARPIAHGNRLDLDGLRERAAVVPELTDRNEWPALEALPQGELDAMRDKVCAGLGVSFHAPPGVALYLFGEDVAVVESFRDEPVACTLKLDGWSDMEAALRVPREGAFTVGQGEIGLPARSLLAVRRV
ncbi:MAG: hypothetical protein R6V05_00050 [Candidatus Brocadiia bacterium]